MDILSFVFDYTLATSFRYFERNVVKVNVFRVSSEFPLSILFGLDRQHFLVEVEVNSNLLTVGDLDRLHRGERIRLGVRQRKLFLIFLQKKKTAHFLLSC
jgi:hypothetical protein